MSLRPLSASPQSAINAACEDWSATKAAYRLFDNEQVTAEKILSPHFQRTVERLSDHERVFAVQDTTYLDYTHHPLTEGLGPIGTASQHIYGFVKHTTLVVTASGLPLGCLRLGSGCSKAKPSQSQHAADGKRELQMD
ncbi:hypothetical protein J4G02_04910 [Candidatus Poribacteria bacterium]|nr:hypothetical protein [Candidatus Poribacteria bacterium]